MLLLLAALVAGLLLVGVYLQRGEEPVTSAEPPAPVEGGTVVPEATESDVAVDAAPPDDPIPASVGLHELEPEDSEESVDERVTELRQEIVSVSLPVVDPATVSVPNPSEPATAAGTDADPDSPESSGSIAAIAAPPADDDFPGPGPFAARDDPDRLESVAPGPGAGPDDVDIPLPGPGEGEVDLDTPGPGANDPGIDGIGPGEDEPKT